MTRFECFLGEGVDIAHDKVVRCEVVDMVGSSVADNVYVQLAGPPGAVVIPYGTNVFVQYTVAHAAGTRRDIPAVAASSS